MGGSGVGGSGVGGSVSGAIVGVCADADFIANARKGMLAALTVVTLSSCRRVRTRCSFFMGAAPMGMGKVDPNTTAAGSFQI
jgi:hypothetical protein